MYTVVLMAALTTPTTAPNHWFRSHGCNGCHGCWGCSGWGCSGCYGCSGSYGWPGCNGFNTCQGAYSCYGCYGCYGGGGFCQGGGFHVHGIGCYGCFGCQGCYGCYGGYACYGTPLPSHGIPHVPQGVIETQPVPKAEETPLPKQKTKVIPPQSDEVSPLNRARVIVQLPADAKLFIDDQPMKSTSDRRVFQTPNLEPGKTYFYDLRAEIEVNGQRISEAHRVILRPGEVANTTFPNLMNAANGGSTPASARRAP